MHDGLKRGALRAASLLSPMPSLELPTREGNRTEAIGPRAQGRATDPCPGRRHGASTSARSALEEPLSRLFRDRTHRAANRLDRAPSRCGGVCSVRVGSNAALFQKCDRHGFVRSDLGKPNASASRCKHASWQVATAPQKRPADRSSTSSRNSNLRTKGLRERRDHANKSRTDVGLEPITCDVLIGARQVDVCGRLSRLVGGTVAALFEQRSSTAISANGGKRFRGARRLQGAPFARGFSLKASFR